MSEGFTGIGEPKKEGEQRILNETETLAFLKEKGIQPLEDWKAGEPLLYVFEEALRDDRSIFGDVAPNERPTLVRIDAPSYLEETKNTFDDPATGQRTRYYGVENERGSRVDYYVINAASGTPKIVRTTYTRKGQSNPYLVRRDTLFSAADEVFPKGED